RSGVFVNILGEDNPDAEANATGWTASGSGTIVRTTTAANIGFGKGSFEYDASAASETLTSPTITIPAGDHGNNCLARAFIKDGDSNLTAEVYDGTNVLASQALVTYTDYTEVRLRFPCPGSGTLAFRLSSSADAAVVRLDEVYIGENWEIGDTSSVEIAGQSFHPFTGSCTWTVTSTSFADFGTVAACPGPTIVEENVGDWQTTDTDLPEQAIDGLPAGKYLMTVSFPLNSTTANSFVAARISDGTTDGQACGTRSVNTAEFHVTCNMLVNYTASGDRVFKLQGKSSSGNARINLAFDQVADVVWTLYRYPTDSQKAFQPRTQGWRVDVNIGGANPTLAGATVSTYTEITDAGLDMVINPGSVNAEIPCSTTNPSTGLTCSAGSEGLGVVVEVPIAGAYEICGNLTVQQTTGDRSTYQWIETPNNAQTILQEGNERHGTGDASLAAATDSFRVCGQFNFASNGQKTLRLMYEKPGAGGGLTLLMDRGASEGQRDMHITMRPITPFIANPLIVDSLNTPAGDGTTFNLFSAGFDLSGASDCVLQAGTEVGNWVDEAGTTRPGAGRCAIAFDTGSFSGIPTCQCTGQDLATGVLVCAINNSPTSSQVEMELRNAAGSLRDQQLFVTCHGPKN
ncbi:MAG: hypothetical protein ACXABY_14475, partial [Candidatus Thorarchaeota archaeon]